VPGLRRNDLIYSLVISVGLLLVGTDALIYRWGRRVLFDGQVFSLVQIPLVDHPLFLQWLGIKLPVVSALALVACGALVSLPALWRPKLVTGIAVGLIYGAAIIGLSKGMGYHHDLLLSLDVQPLGVVRWSLVLLPSALALLFLLAIDARWLWKFRQRNGPLPIAIAAAYSMLRGDRQVRKERFDEAEKSFRRAYEQTRARLGEDDPRTLRPLAKLAWFSYDHAADRSEAGRLFRMGNAIAQKGQHVDRALVADLIDGLGSATMRDGDRRGALRLYEQAVRDAEEVHGRKGWQVATPLRHLAWATMMLSNLEEAERLCQRSVDITQWNCGRRSAALVQPMALLAQIREAQGRLEEAARLREQVLQLAGGPDGANTERALALIELARIRARQGRDREANSLYQEALAMASAGRAEARRVVSDALSGLASLRRSAGQFIEAEQLAGRALTDSEASWGSDSLAVVGPLIELGQVFAEQDKPQQARAYFERAIATVERRWGSADPSLAIPLECLGWLERAQGNYERAETITRRAIALIEADDGPEDASLVSPLRLLAAIASDRDNHTEAIQIFERGRTVAQKAFGRNHLKTAHILARLAYEHEMTDDLPGAERLHREEIASLRSSVESNDTAIADALERFADFLQRQDRADEAVEAKRQSMEIIVKHAWEHPADTI
jgi:tetratricopeptide (TPR) repeat protein